MIRKYIKKLIFRERCDSETYVKYLRSIGMRIGGVRIFEPFRTVIDVTRPWLIEIGENVQITQGVTILTHGYDWSVLKGKYGKVLGSSGKVTIGNNVFVGMHATILKGVQIGNNVIIGAGSVVCKDIPDNCVAAGNPAKVIMSLEEYYEKRERKQEEEARELVHEYRTVYHKDPSEEHLSEFFWLFSDGTDVLPACYESKMKLVGNYEESMKELKQHKKKYDSLQDFLKSVK